MEEKQVGESKHHNGERTRKEIESKKKIRSKRIATSEESSRGGGTYASMQ